MSVYSLSTYYVPNMVLDEQDRHGPCPHGVTINTKETCKQIVHNGEPKEPRPAQPPHSGLVGLFKSFRVTLAVVCISTLNHRTFCPTVLHPQSWFFSSCWDKKKHSVKISAVSWFQNLRRCAGPSSSVHSMSKKLWLFRNEFLKLYFCPFCESCFSNGY